MNDSDLSLKTGDAISKILKVSNYFDFIYLSKKYVLCNEHVKQETSPEEKSEFIRVLNGHYSLASIDYFTRRFTQK